MASKLQISKLLLHVTMLCVAVFVSSSSSTPPTILCKPQEKSALLEFKNLFSVYPYEPCDDSIIYHWDYDNEDCCKWLGVECNNGTGYVIRLLLDSNCLYGMIPTNSSLFSLPHLEHIFLGYNYLNNSEISPLFSKLKNLTVLDLKESDLSGVVPSEIFQLPKLQTLDLSGNTRLTGTISGINATELISLDLSGTGFSGKIPNVIGQLEKLQKLSLSGCNFSGPIPASLGYLRELNILDLGGNSFSGKVPLSFSNLKNLTQLDLSHNYLEGSILDSVLKNTRYIQLLLSQNQFKDNVDLIQFTSLHDLEYLDLSNSGLSLTTTNANFLSTFHSIRTLALSSCNLNIENKTINIFSHPEVETESLLSGPIYLDLSNNKINEQILIDSVCKLNIFYLDLSSNELSGEIPVCLFRSIPSLSMIKLGGNNFSGTIPYSVEFANNLILLDLSDNNLQGDLPRSLVNCMQLEVLNLGGNKLVDVFPFWLGKLPFLKVLILRENKIYGTMTRTSGAEGEFANLRIIDMSQNDLTANLPSEYLYNWEEMMTVSGDEWYILKTKQSFCDYGDKCPLRFKGPFYCMLTISYKGSELYQKVDSGLMKVVDFSSNKFSGQIPSSMGWLVGIELLNLSSNTLTGPIPNSFIELGQLEVLDLSSNKLSGEIPLKMSNLYTLTHLNMSRNNLTGKIPQSVFSNNSYAGNPGLCGLPLSRLCDYSPIPQTVSDNHHGFMFEVDDFGWEIVLIGYVCGIVIGLTVGSFISVAETTWFVRTLNLIGVQHRTKINKLKVRK